MKDDEGRKERKKGRGRPAREGSSLPNEGRTGKRVKDDEGGKERKKGRKAGQGRKDGQGRKLFA